MTTRPPVVGSDRLHSPTINDILAWRERLAAKYRDQLDDGLTWDEGSPFEVAEDVATSGDAMFHYVAAILDQRGTAELRKLVDVTEPPTQEYNAVFAEADRRGFGGRFPHLLLGAQVWLPFKNQLMIEEPNWNGKLDRFGSVFHLLDEVTTVRAAIADVEPSVTSAFAAERSGEVMVAAWLTSNTILRLATIAATKQLPIWTTG